MAEAGVEAGSEASEWENREREEHLTQMAEGEARLGGEEQTDTLVLMSFFLGGGGFDFLFPDKATGSKIRQRSQSIYNKNNQIQRTSME